MIDYWRVFTGKNVWIAPSAIILGDVTIGDDVYIGHNTVIGTPPEHGTRHYAVSGEPHGTHIVIGSGTEIRENVTIHAPMAVDGITTIGANCILMSHSHIGHDVTLADDVKVCTGAVLGGYTKAHKGANIGLNATTHQFSTVGAYAMIGMGSVVTKDVPPCGLVYGNPAKLHAANRVGLARAGYAWDSTELFAAKLAWDQTFLADSTREVMAFETENHK